MEMSTLILLLALLPTTYQADTIKVRVYAEQNPGGFTDPDLKRREDSVKDLKKALEDKKGLVLVETADESDIEIEVLHSSLAATGSTRSTTTVDGRQARTTTTPTKAIDLVVALRVRGTEYETEIRSDWPDSPFWRVHAGIIAKKVEKWVKENRQNLKKTL